MNRAGLLEPSAAIEYAQHRIEELIAVAALLIAARGAESLRMSDMVSLEGGWFVMGSDHHYPEEAPARRVFVSPFMIDRAPVTNAEFAEFIAATGYVTFAERPPEREHYPAMRLALITPGSIVFRATPQSAATGPETWWRYEKGAHWRCPFGPAGPDAARDHPVVHVVFEDAIAYAHWAGKRLPTEPEAEFASRGGLEPGPYAWGEELTPKGRLMANIWLSDFPHTHPRCPNPPYTTPAGAFPANAFGLFDMIGNVWEWTSTPANGAQEGESCCGVVTSPSVRKVLKGGSHLCAPNYCRRYRPAARWFQPTDTSTSHIGFRCASSAADTG